MSDNYTINLPLSNELRDKIAEFVETGKKLRPPAVLDLRAKALEKERKKWWNRTFRKKATDEEILRDYFTGDFWCGSFSCVLDHTEFPYKRHLLTEFMDLLDTNALYNDTNTVGTNRTSSVVHEKLSESQKNGKL